MIARFRMTGRLAAAVVAAFLAFSPVAAQAANYGAIAYSPSTGAYGLSYDYHSRGSAQRRALAECRARSRGCRTVLWFRNACGALAVGNSGWGTGWGTSRGLAQRYAIQSCSRHTYNCGIRAWACTTR